MLECQLRIAVKFKKELERKNVCLFGLCRNLIYLLNMLNFLGYKYSSNPSFIVFQIIIY
jgi:hypothetical protein